jgi:adenine-specific DNA-methyltransferase
MPDPIRWGLDNPHPLSQMKTGLVWAGKYDATDRCVAPVRIKLPFQAVETVNETAQERQMALDLFSTGRPAEWRNRLIWGDKRYVLPALLEEFAGQVDLIYIDLPFNAPGKHTIMVKVIDILGNDTTKTLKVQVAL